MSSLDEPPSSTESLDSTKNAVLSAQRRRGMKLSNFEGSFSIAHVTLTAPSFLTGYLLLNGATDLQLTVILALPYFLMTLQLIAAFIVSKTGNRKVLCGLGLVVFSGVHVLLGLIPFIPGLSQSDRLWLVFGLLLASNIGFMLLANTWWLWMADLVPDKIRGRFFGFRSGFTLILGTVWSLLGGSLLDYYKARGEAAYGFCVIFSIASACALAGLFFLTRQYEPPVNPEPIPSFRQIFGILKNNNYRRAATFLFIWNFGVGLMMFLIAKHMLGYMMMSYQQVLLYTVIVNLVGFAIAKQWGKLMDVVGTRTMLLLCGLAAGFIPLLWLFTAPGTMWPIWIDAIATGMFMTGMNIAALNLPLVITPRQYRLYYLAIFAAITGLGVGIAAILAGKIAMMLEGIRWIIPGTQHVLVNYHVIFAFSAFFRLGSMYLLIHYQEENGRSLVHALSRIRNSVIRLLPGRLPAKLGV